VDPAPDTIQGLIDGAGGGAARGRVRARITEHAPQLTYGRAAAPMPCRVAAWLRSQGVAPGEVVSLVMPNGLGTLQLLLGAMHGGWCVNPVNLLVAARADALRAGAFRLQAGGLHQPTGSRACVPSLATLGRAGGRGGVDPDALGGGPIAWPTLAGAAPPTPGAADVHLGHHRQPKGVMLTQANLAANAPRDQRPSMR
jgi:long-chain acyl-CoA synthetase